MVPSYHHLQLVVLNKHDRDFQRGDVAAFWCEELSCTLVKRIAALPGDRVIIQEGSLYVNGQISQAYAEPGLFAYAGILEKEIFLGPGEYLLFGDNTSESKDSRYPEVGIISESHIFGKICTGS